MLFTSSQACPTLSNKDIVSWMLDNPTYDKDEPIYIDAVDPSHSLSYNQSLKLVRQLVAGFHELNLPPKSCILVNSFNTIYFPVLFIGIVASGHIFAGANPAYTSLELSHHIKVTEAAFIIAEGDLLEKCQQAAKEHNIPNNHILSFHGLNEKPNRSSNTHSWSDVLLSHGERDWERFDDPQRCRTEIICRLTSSGTTGLPKACPWTHLNAIAQHELCQLRNWSPRTHTPRFMFATPMFHAATVPRCHCSALKTGDASYIMRRFDLEAYLKYIDLYKITELFAVPPMAIAISSSPLVTSGKYSLRSLQRGVSGAAPLSKETQAAIMKYMHPDATYTQVYGMTESTCCVCCVQHPEDDRSGSSGFALPGHELKLVDDDGKDITGYDVRGEACWRGPLIISGYCGVGSEKANEETWDEDGFYHSGDIVVIKKSEDTVGGWKLFVVDRKKELIKVRAFQVAPAELEGVLLQHKGVVDVAVIGVKAEREIDGELPRAYVVRTPGYKPEVTEADIKKWIADRLSNFKRVEGGVKFIDVIPKTPSGKILKRTLREWVKQEGQGGAKL